MRKHRRRTALLTLLSCIAVASLAPMAHAAGSLGLAKWEAGTCKGSEAEVKECKYSSPSMFYTQAAGHPPWGLTGFELATTSGAPNGSALKRIRVDVPPGLAADPVTLGTCPVTTFEANGCESKSEAGFVELKAYIAALGTAVTLKGKVYNLPEEPGHPLRFGIKVEGEPLTEDVHLLLEGYVSYAKEPSLEARGIESGDFHEWFEINNIPREVTIEVPLLKIPLTKTELKTVESKLFFDGHAGINGKENFLTLPSNCKAPSTSYLELETYPPVEKLSQATTPPVKVEGCENVPFAPLTEVTPTPAQYDSPDGAVTRVKVPQYEKATQTNTSDIDDAVVTLPEGLTLNPAAATGLESCTEGQLQKGTTNPVECPAASKIGTVKIETDLPPESLSGNVYLGRPNGTAKITNPPFLIFIDAESVYGVSVRLIGKAEGDPNTGRLKVTFENNPQLPFSELELRMDGGPRAPLANPATCAAASTDSDFTPYTEQAAALASTPFQASGCPSPVPFDVAQGTSESSNKAGAFTSFEFALNRPEGNQNLSRVQTTLPAGLVGLIPSVKLCGEPQAAEGKCASSSQIGEASATVGVGSEPIAFKGPVDLTGPTEGQPYGLSIPIAATAGPFELGVVTTRVGIGVEPHSGRVVATSNLPRVFKGVALHLRGLTVTINRANFMFNPTYCGGLSTNSLLSAIQGATTAPSTPFAVTSCSSLPFKPAFAASSPTTPSRANGASLTVSYTQPAHQANIRSVVAQLPKQLPSRLSTLNKACTEAVFNANPYSCPKESRVGTATVATPVLPEKLTGPAYLVSHGGASFPNLELILEGDHGVKVLLEGKTQIKDGITTSTFASVPDVPVSSFELSLPTGPYSALGSYGSLCAKPLYMPTTITAQSGTVIKENVRISIGSCKIKLLSHRIEHGKLVLKVQVFTAGRVSVKSPGLHLTYKRVAGPKILTIKVPLSKQGKRRLGAHGSVKMRFRVGFNPVHSDEYHSAAYATVTFRH